MYDTFTDFFIDEKVDPPQDTVILMCKSASSLESKVTYNWTLNGKSVQAGLRFKINDSSLVVNVTETIRGFFSCVGSNPLIHTSSEYYFLETNCTNLWGNETKEAVEVLQGNSVKFSLKESTEKMRAVEWHFKNSQKQLAVAMLGTSGLVNSAYTNRMEIDVNKGSLTILGVQMRDAGTFTASIRSCKKRWQENIKLDVKGKKLIFWLPSKSINSLSS
uniref:Ig-like domain-containing protein n=1 Tax=Eptatretus burgeri TaxID=7764 RepID=A0A8C4NFD6_EPTBU